MDNLRRLKKLKNIPLNRHYLRDRSNPLDHLEDHEIQARFRFLKDTVRSIFDLITTNQRAFYGKASNNPPMLQLLAILRFSLLEVFKALLGTCCIFGSRRLVVFWAKLF